MFLDAYSARWRSPPARCCRPSRRRRTTRPSRSASSCRSRRAAWPTTARGRRRPPRPALGQQVIVENRAGRERQHRLRPGAPRRRPTATPCSSGSTARWWSTRTPFRRCRSIRCATSRRSPSSATRSLSWSRIPSVPATQRRRTGGVLQERSRAASPSAARAPAARRTSPAKCSSSAPARTSCTSATRAAARRSSTSSAGRFRSPTPPSPPRSST